MMDPARLKQTSTHYIRVLLEQARRSGLDVEATIKQFEIPREALSGDTEYVSNEFSIALIRHLWRNIGDETFGLDSAPTRPGSFALICEYAISAATLGEFLRRVQRIISYVMLGDSSLEIRERAGEVELRVPTCVSERDPERFLSEFWSIIWHRLPSWLIDEKIQLSSAGFPYPEPAHSRLYRQLFQCDVRFGQTHAYLRFSSRYLSRPVVRSPHDLARFLQRSPADFTGLPGKRRSFRSSMVALLKKLQESGHAFPGFDTVCDELNMSPQVVRRRLKEEGTSYQRIKDRLRRDRAIDLLVSSDLPIAAIAERVGFADPPALSRAFKQWTGLTPAQYRDQSSSE